MSDLGDILELLHRSQRAFKTLRGEFSIWTHSERSHEAFLAGVADSEGTAYAFAVSKREVPAAAEEQIRAWIKRPDRIRVEYRNGLRGTRDAVRIGSVWWLIDESMGALTNEGGGDVDMSVGDDIDPLLSPWPRAGFLAYEYLGVGQVAGRSTRRARGRPVERTPAQFVWALHGLGAGAEEYELDVDDASGLLLRVEARRDGSPFQIIEARSLELDLELPPGTFELEPPPGERFETPDLSARHIDLPLSAASARASFEVFVPESVPRDWELNVSFSGASERPPAPEAVFLGYRSKDGSVNVSISESPWKPESADEYGEDPPWEIVSRGRLEFRVRHRRDDWPEAQLLHRRGDTAIRILSSSLEVESLIGLASMLVPAPTEAPDLSAGTD